MILLGRLLGWLSEAQFTLLLLWRWWLGGLGIHSRDARRLPDASACEIDPAMVFTRRFELPVAAFIRLRKTSALLINRLTPFRDEDIYWDVRVIGRSPTSRLIEAELAAVPRETVAALLASRGRPATSLAIAGDAPVAGVRRFELLEVARVRSSSALKHRIVAVGLLIGALGCADAAWSYRQRQTLHQLEETIAALRPQAAEAAARRRDRMLADRPMELRADATARSSIGLLQALTVTLPEDAQIVELRRNGAVVDLRGFTVDAPKLLQVIEQAPAFEGVRFVAPVSRNQGDSRDYFSMQLSYLGVAP
ncbi:hypothetical protein D3874_27360 [Oleomonas cavernae]|uniref:Fimbrial assembly protein n=1 Tax=Oleomonas cavernae TaxID=2320859 RepID=A0A418VUJ5_9PROT|nr:PilN domain-containing protein [Oleomonas cavernae]RJF80803.1 hypothetical protein D3874_27360 [Oleomonas cavernae]